VSLLRFPKVDTQSQGTILFLENRTGGASCDWDDQMNPFSKYVIEELTKETKLCAREWIDVAVRRCLVILEVNFMIKLVMRRHVLSSSIEKTLNKY